MPLIPANAAHYVRYRMGRDVATTQTTEAERKLLAELAPGKKVIVEIGVFEGASSLLLREAMDQSAELICIDPFPRGRLLFSPQLGISRREIGRSRNGRVQIIRKESHEGIKGWARQIDLLFLDGDHSFEGASRDFREWSKFVDQRGLILIHTSHSSINKAVPEHCGPLRLVEEIIASDHRF